MLLPAENSLSEYAIRFIVLGDPATGSLAVTFQAMSIAGRMCQLSEKNSAQARRKSKAKQRQDKTGPFRLSSMSLQSMVF